MVNCPLLNKLKGRTWIAVLMASDVSITFSVLEFAFTIHIVIYAWFLLFIYYNTYGYIYIFSNLILNK